MRIGSVSGIAGRGDSSIIRPVPDAETLPFVKAILVIQAYAIFKERSKPLTCMTTALNISLNLFE